MRKDGIEVLDWIIIGLNCFLLVDVAVVCFLFWNPWLLPASKGSTSDVSFGGPRAAVVATVVVDIPFVHQNALKTHGRKESKESIPSWEYDAGSSS